MHGTCPLCGVRKARRECPALGRMICAVCCGTKRLVEIPCPDSCPYLASAREHPAAVVQRRQERDLRFFLPLVPQLTALSARARASLLVMWCGYGGPVPALLDTMSPRRPTPWRRRSRPPAREFHEHQAHLPGRSGSTRRAPGHARGARARAHAHRLLLTRDSATRRRPPRGFQAGRADRPPRPAGDDRPDLPRPRASSPRAGSPGTTQNGGPRGGSASSSPDGRRRPAGARTRYNSGV